jgi:hypothetical protein
MINCLSDRLAALSSLPRVLDPIPAYSDAEEAADYLNVI